MTLNELLDQLFPAGHSITVTNKAVVGEATTSFGTVAVLGTTDAAAVDHEIALTLSKAVLDVVQKTPGRSIVFLVDTVGQALSRGAELLCLNGSFAYLAKCVDLARRSGHKSVSLVTSNAVSGGFLSFGLMADRAYALKDVSVRVMDLKAMSRVTKLDYDRLVDLAKTSPTFAPGAENYERMGGIESIWADVSESRLSDAFNAIDNARDLRMEKGSMRTGRTEALKTTESVLAA
jgi:malonate decarboxylase gamma subunit